MLREERRSFCVRAHFSSRNSHHREKDTPVNSASKSTTAVREQEGGIERQRAPPPGFQSRHADELKKLRCAFAAFSKGELLVEVVY
jgi:hypothetical protein